MLINDLQNWIEQFLLNSGLTPAGVPYVRLLIMMAVLAIIAWVIHVITKKLVIGSFYKFLKNTSFTWDDLFVDHKVFDNVAHIVPALFLKSVAEIIFRDFDQLLPWVIKLTDSYLIIVGMMVVLLFIKVIELLMTKIPAFYDKPIASYFQVVRIIIYTAVGILVLSVLMGRSPFYFLSAFGAMTAILLLIFKDTILGLVASVQISTNDMVRVGDWVEMPKFNADGDVLAINLNTVKIQNWDKTITTVPTYHFITDSFKNWRGMQESGGRRIKRSILINVQSIKFVDPETRELYKSYNLIKEFIIRRQLEIEAFNIENKVDTTHLINGRRMTNIGVFRNYIELYLRSLKTVRQDMTLLVRQLPMADHGLPIEIYCFTNTTSWTEYETIVADIFDHLLAAAIFFDLDVFQKPSGSDIASFTRGIGEKHINPETSA
jgi:miniconductance mechanosensitive channel